MKKKYLALIMACILCTSVFITGCGKTADVIEEEDDDDEDDEDEDEDEEDDEDDDADRDDKDEHEDTPVYVNVIDPDTLNEQIKVFAKNKNVWSIPNNSSAGVKDAAYALTDLDHNGRCELLCMTAFYGTNVTSARIFEISEKGDFFEESDWKFDGLEVSDTPCPDFIYYPFPLTYHDSDTGLTHYMMLESYEDSEGNMGTCYDDVTYSGGTVSSYIYGASLEYEYYDITTDSTEYRYTYTTDKGEVTETEYYDYRYEYAGGLGNLSDCAFGVYYRGWYDDFGVMGLDDAFLRDVLTDSYKVFAGEKSYSEFYGRYNESGESESSGFVDYDKCIGSWKLLYLETEGDVVYYEEDGPQFATLTIDNSRRATISQYRDGVISLEFTLDVFFDENDHPYFDYDDRDALPDGFMMERYTIVEMSEDGDQITVFLDFYGEDGILGGSTLVFERG